jgi:hypothetical protein
MKIRNDSLLISLQNVSLCIVLIEFKTQFCLYVFLKVRVEKDCSWLFQFLFVFLVTGDGVEKVEEGAEQSNEKKQSNFRHNYHDMVNITLYVI